MRLRWSMVVLAVVVVSSCGRAMSDARSDTQNDAPNVAEVRCGRDGSTEVLTPTVQAQADGVHVAVSIPPDSDLAFIVPGQGENAEDGPFTFAIPPGEMSVACVAHEHDQEDDSSLTVVDYDGVYVDGTMRCEDYTGVSGEYPGSSLGDDPVGAARDFLNGIRLTDVLEQVGYVGRSTEASVAVRRGGEVVAVLALESVGEGNWGWSGFSSCPDAGISY